MKPLPSQTLKQRTKIVTDFFYSYEPYRDRIGKRYFILVTDLSHDKAHYVGHNQFYEQILVPKQDELLGNMVEVEIVQATKFSMIGQLLDGSIQSPNDIRPLKLGQVSGLTAQSDKKFKRIQQNSNLFKWSFAICLFVLILRFFQLLFWMLLFFLSQSFRNSCMSISISLSM